MTRRFTFAISTIILWSLAAPAAAAMPAGTGTQECPTRPVPITSLAMTASDYPLLSVMNNEEGRVVLDFLVTEDGTVTDIHVAKSSGFARLDGASVDAARQRWRYNQVFLGGKAVSCRWKIAVDWHLESTPEELEQFGPFTIVRMTSADYPPDILKRHEEGATAVITVIDESGRVVAAEVEQPSHYSDLDKASVDTILKGKWRIAPARLDDKPIKTEVGIVVIWSLTPPPPQKK